MSAAGGDDLCDDEIYLNINNLGSRDDDDSTNEVNPETVDNILVEHEEDFGRKRNQSDTGQNTSQQKRNKRHKTESMRNIACEDKVKQADYLWSCFQNALTDKNVDTSDMKSKFTPSRICVFEGSTASSSQRINDSNIAINFRSLLSEKKLMKKAKKHKSLSPLVVIVCISARRCVSVLKGLAPLKIRCGKLFAKHMNPKQQAEMLEKESYSIVVGTPNRLLKLCDDGALKVTDTEIVVFDGAEINGCQNVCTLNDTRVDFALLIKKHLSPQMNRIQFGMY